MKPIIFLISVFTLLNCFTKAQENKIIYKKTQSNYFGWDISASGNICCISDPMDSVTEKTNGSVQVYIKSGNKWIYKKTITKSQPKQFEYFGHSVAASPSFIAISAIGTSKKGFMSGSVSVYRIFRDDITFLYELFPLTSQKKSYFGDEVKIINNQLYVGASGANKTGVVYIYELATGNLKQMISPTDIPEKIQFGKCITANNKFLFIGASAQNMSGQNGAVYVYKLNENNEWDFSNKLYGDSLNVGSLFGISLSCQGNSLVVGAPHEDIIQNSETKHFAGSIYLFNYDSVKNKWTLRNDIDNPQANSHDLFGSKVILKDSIIYTSTPRKDKFGKDQGVVYFIKYPEPNSSQTKLIKTVYPEKGFENEYFGYNFEVSNNDLFVCVSGNNSRNNNAYVYYYTIDSINNIKKLNISNDISFETFPNPANNFIQINVNENKENTCTLYDSRGTKILQFNLTIGSAKVDITNISPGIYYLNYTSASLSIVKEIVIIR